MSIDLKKLLSRKLETSNGGPTFQFQQVGDQLIFAFKATRRVKSKVDDASLIVDVEVLSGQKINEHGVAEPVPPGPSCFFPSSVLRTLLDSVNLREGDIVQVQLTEIVAKKNNMKLYGFEVIERSKGQGSAAPL
jgi:hypothetical protein